MGIEYLLRPGLPLDLSDQALARRLPPDTDPATGAVIYGYQVEPDGLLFVDHLVDSTVASLALRRLLDAVLDGADAVSIREP